MQLRVATLNVWALPEPLGEDVDARMRAIVDELPALGLDVLGLQEVWLESARDQLIEGGRRAGLVHAWSSADDGWDAGGGLLLLSRYPMRDVRFEPFSLRGDVERLEQGEYFGGKGYLSAVLESERGPVQVVNTHLHARYGNATAHRYRPHRTAQLLQLVVQGLDPKLPVVLMGDFNFSERGPEYRILRDVLGLFDSPAELGRVKPTVYASNPYRGRATLLRAVATGGRRKDFIFRRDGVQLEVRPISAARIFDQTIEVAGREAAYSNHAGVMVDFEVTAASYAVPIVPDEAALDLAASLLHTGRVAALERAANQGAWAWTGAGVAVAAVGGAQTEPVSRRRFLRGVLHAAAAVAVLPGAGLALTSQWVLPREVEAFEEAERLLARVGPLPGEVVVAEADDGLEGA